MFREYIRECVINGTDITVEIEHLESVTFEDVCMIIHLVMTKGKKLMLSDATERQLDYATLVDNCTVWFDNGMTEELAIIMFIVLCDTHYTHPIRTYLPVNDEQGYAKMYEMSPNFVLAARRCGVDDYMITKHIIAAFDIKYEHDTEEAEGYLNNRYLGPNLKNPSRGSHG